MRLLAQSVEGWPKLAWLAWFRPGADTVVVYHGSCVETDPQWCVEAVWAGSFPEAEFDRTDLVFGTGLRVRDDHVVCVSAGSTMDRLWRHEDQDGVRVSNSLPAILAVVAAGLLPAYTDYARDIDSLQSGGVTEHRCQIPCTRGTLQSVYYRNLVWDGQELSEVDKPDSAPCFDVYETYQAYLESSARLLGQNLADPSRAHAIRPLTTLSQGYDSCAAAVVAGYAGCRDAVTISKASSFWRGSDSGEEIASCLGMECRTYDRVPPTYPLEEAVWAVSGYASVLNWIQFDYPQPLSLLFTAPYGDLAWRKERRQYRRPFCGTSPTQGGIGEYRLFRGVYHCPVPFWGLLHLPELQEITFSEAMEPWSIGGDYDRPIPRRLVEQAGVPRELFGQRKKNTSTASPFLWPHSPEAAASFRRFLSATGRSAHCSAGVWWRRRWIRLAHLVQSNLPGSWARNARQHRRRQMDDMASLLFCWANETLRDRYRDGLLEADVEVSE